MGDCPGMCHGDPYARPKTVDIGICAYAHVNCAEMTAEAIATDIVGCMTPERLRYPLVPVLAYRYGATTCATRTSSAMTSASGVLGVQTGWRLGDGIHRPPLQHSCRIPRIGVRGTDSLQTLQINFRLGCVCL
jgi:hypothetical protein